MLWHIGHTRQLLHDSLKIAHAGHLLHLFAEIFQIKALALLQLPGKFLGLGVIDAAMHFLDQRQHVAHTQDA